MTLLTLLVILAAPRMTDEARRLESLYDQVAVAYDGGRGGFVRGDGTPIEGAIELAFAMVREKGDPEWLARAHATVDWMHGLIDSTCGSRTPTHRAPRSTSPRGPTRDDSRT